MSNEDRHKPEETPAASPVVNDIDGHAAANDPEADIGRVASVGATADDDVTVRREMSRRSRRSFLVMGVAAAGGIAGWEWLKTRAAIDDIPYPLRRAHEFNERLFESYFKGSRLAPTFARSLAAEPRVNGEEGMTDGFDPSTWRLQVLGLAEPMRYPQYVNDVNYESQTTDNSNAPDDSADSSDNSDEADGDEDTGGGDSGDSENNKDSKSGAGDNNQQAGDNAADASPAADEPEPGLLLTLEDIKRLPRVEMTTELKCIEGWSVVVNWAGARLSDFAAKYQPPARGGGGAPDVRGRPQDLVRYVGMETPDGGYYVGMDMPSALHPQTLLCYEMNGQPLTLPHGAPLRLVTPVKYGIKHIKRIGRITFTDQRPDDYWAERGYDWYSGH